MANLNLAAQPRAQPGLNCRSKRICVDQKGNQDEQQHYKSDHGGNDDYGFSFHR
jgi:hypothetical protein